MKPILVSLLLSLLAACEIPSEPPPLDAGLRIPPDVDGPVVITGRIVSAAAPTGIQAANVRVIDAGISVGTDETGHYRIALPASYRGQVVPVHARAIGFKPQGSSVALIDGRATVDFELATDAMVFTCDLVITVGRQ
jgi:hypothetical protein